jgi:cytochrome c peroxidase
MAPSVTAGLLLICEFAIAATAADILADLGQALFFDTNLSAKRNQSCGSCHDPGRAFSDSRDNGVSGAVSLGDDGKSLGDRNTPGTTYAFLIPDFHKNDKDEYVGGYFLDGRAATMADQAAGRAATMADQAAEPFVNPLEMAMPDSDAVVARVRENPVYLESFSKHYGESIFSDSRTRRFAPLPNPSSRSNGQRSSRRSIRNMTVTCAANTS